MNDAKTFFSSTLKKFTLWGLIGCKILLRFGHFVIYKFEFAEHAKTTRVKTTKRRHKFYVFLKMNEKFIFFSWIYSICSHFLPLSFFALKFYVQTDTGSRILRQNIWGHKMVKKNCQFYYLLWVTCFSNNFNSWRLSQKKYSFLIISDIHSL